MNRLIIALSLTAGLAVTALSCARPLDWTDPMEPENNKDMVTVVFSVAGEERAKATGVSAASEVRIGRWAVFAFDQSIGWYRYATSLSGEDIPMNLVAGRSYSCYAIVNYSTSGTGAFQPEHVKTPSDLTEKVAYLGDNSVGNLLMFGADTIVPEAGESGTRSICVQRIVSRINITRVAVDFSEAPALAAKTFTLKHIYITNAYRTTRFGDDFPASGLSGSRSAWYNSGGWHRGENGESSMDALLGGRNLNAVITQANPYTVTHTFYAFPNATKKANDNHSMERWTPRCTRIVLEATLDDDTVYYWVNVPEMERNHIYTADNVVIRGRGSNDPEIYDIDPGVLDVSFNIRDGWDGNDRELNL